jgi:uncharacterized protein (UPF0262 family)
MRQEWIESIPLEEAEMLARKAKMIKERMYGKYHRNVLCTTTLLSNLLATLNFRPSCSKGHYFDKNRTLLEQLLTITINMSECERDNDDIAATNLHLSECRHVMSDQLPLGDARTEQLRTAERYQLEAMRINPEIAIAELTNTFQALSMQGGKVRSYASAPTGDKSR